MMEQSGEKKAQEKVKRKNNWTATWIGGIENGNGEGLSAHSMQKPCTEIS